MPGGDRDGPVTAVGVDEACIRLRPGRGFRTLHPCAVPRRTSTGLWWTVGTGRWIGIEDSVVANTAEHLGTNAGEIVPDGDRVITGVEDEQRDGTRCRQEGNEALHLADGWPWWHPSLG